MMYNKTVVKIENIMGRPVENENFFGRDAELEELQAITEREHVLLLAPRRVGKTSLLHALVKRVERDGSALGVYASVAPATSEAQFVQAVLKAIYQTRRGRKLRRGLVARALGAGRGVKSVKVAGSGIDLETRTRSWQDDADRAFAAIVTSHVPLLILIDELPVLVLALAKSDPSGARVRTFLQWFRNLRQHPDGANKLRFVLAGSIGLDNVTRRHQLSDTINDLRVWPLGPFAPAAAHEFIRRLATSYNLELGPDLCAEICRAARSEQLTTETLRGAIETLLDRRTYFSYWDERLHDSLGEPSASIARALLATCSQASEGATPAAMSQCIAPLIGDLVERAKTFKWIVDVLANDGYLVEHDGRWRFRSGLLRRYWARHVT